LTRLPVVVSDDSIRRRGQGRAATVPWPEEWFDGQTRLVPDEYIKNEMGYVNGASFRSAFQYRCTNRGLRPRMSKYPDGQAIRADKKTSASG